MPRVTEKSPARAPVTEGQVREIVDELLRTAMREHSRTLEKHLASIHQRLVTLETKP